jgi:hypothetical protein
VRVDLLRFHTRLAILFTIVLSIIPTFLYAQISQGGTPYSFDVSLDRQIDQVVLPSVDVNALIAEDELERGATTPVPPRFGFAHEVSLNIMEHGTWTELDNGDRLWRLKLHSPSAYSINLIYDEFYLPPGATFFIYNQDKTEVIGAFTDFNNKEHGKFSTSPIAGDVTILEYYEPKGARGKVKLSISKVVHAYRNMFGKPSTPKENHQQESGHGSSLACNININCSEGAPYQDEKRAVAMILLGDGTRWCSGSLINNVNGDAIPYFLTANHCLTGDVGTWIFMFNYESSGCSNSDGPTHQTISGATLRANHANTDFALLELSNKPPKSYETYYLGWSRSTTAPQTSTIIHHPAGDIKKISFDYEPAVQSTWLGDGSTSGPYWRIELTDGTTEGGSSGAPQLDQNKRVVGQNRGGFGGCPNPSVAKYYGRFNLSWNGGGTNSTRLRNWLDPDNTGTLTLNGMDDPYPHVPTNFVLDPMGTHPKLAWQPSASGNVTNYNIYRMVYPTTPSWQHLISTISTSYEDTDVNISPFGSGSIDVFYRVTAVNTANLESVPSNSEYTQGDWNMFAKTTDAEESKQVLPSAFQLQQNYPNPFNPATEIRFDLPETAQVQLSIFDVTGREVARLVEETMEAGSHQVSWSAGNLSSGVYVMYFRAGNFIQSRSMVLLK